MFAFSHSKTAFAFNILLVPLIVAETYIFSGLKLICICICAMYKRQYTDKTLTLWKSMYICERALNFLPFLHTKSAISLNILLVIYFRYFVGTNDMLVGLHVPTNFQMYLQNSLPPPPPWLRYIVLLITNSREISARKRYSPLKSTL